MVLLMKFLENETIQLQTFKNQNMKIKQEKFKKQKKKISALGK